MIKRYSYLFLLFLNFDLLATFNRSLFYRVSSFYGEPRLQKDYLTTLEAELSGGKSCIYQNKYKFEIFQADFNYYQNINHGLFFHFHLPIETIQIYPRKFKFGPTLKIKSENTELSKRGLSDSTLFIGFTRNYEDTEYLDYIDFDIKTGILFPTGKVIKNLSCNNIPYGYNGHWSIPFQFDISTGAYEWLTVGAHFDGVGFFAKKNNFKLKNEKICLKTKPGPVIRVGSYFKADHFIIGLSMLMGITFEHQSKTHFYKNNIHNIDLNNIKNFIYFRDWNRTILHFQLEYDNCNSSKDRAIRVGLVYNYQIHGKNVFKTNMTAGYIGLDLGWYY